MSDDLFLGIDGGQSSTTALIGDHTGRVIGYGRGGPCNHISGPEAKARFVNAIGAAVRAALPAGEPPQFRAACLGFSGGAEDKERWLDEIFTAEHRFVTHDGLIALSGATAGAPGVIIIGGTGSFAFGRNAAGRTARAGGWGYVFGDEGGGFDTTRQALRAALRDEEGWGPKTTLRARLLAISGARDANDLLHRLYTPEFPRPTVAAWAQLVDEAATIDRDASAIEILANAGRHLAAYALAVHRNLFDAATTAPIVPIGGVFQSSRLMAAFEQALGRASQPPLYGPAAGALIEAYRVAGRATVTLSQVPEFTK